MARFLRLYPANICLMNAQFFKNHPSEIVESPYIKRENSFAGILRQANNPKIEALDLKIERYARVHHHVLLMGERGTGKTTIARRIHNKGARRKKQFVSLNCATLQTELVEAELFGYEKGAFTGANQMKAGLFEIGNGGTVFLDEIGELSLSLQAKLLKAVEEKRIRRVGAAAEIPVDLRVIAATSRNLPAMIANGEFRADLYDRLNVLSLNTVPLREQREKIRGLVTAGLEQERIALNRRNRFRLESSAFALLENYTWTGNFRELNNLVLKLATEHLDAEIITKKDVLVLLAEKEINVDMPDTKDELVPNAVISTGNFLTLEINPETHLDQIIEQVKELYICHHLKDKSFRRTATTCRISRSMIRRIADKLETNNYQPNL